jgi:2-keto-3-deoxy-L-rhamnonate aldolase RhmA
LYEIVHCMVVDAVVSVPRHTAAMNETPWQHPLRQRLAAGELVLAATLVTSSIEATAHLATLGYHCLWVEMEHSPITLETLRLMVLATRGLPATVLARIPLTELWTAKRVLDQGVSGVVFPFVSSPELADRAAAACRYPPFGLRGSGAGLASSTWPAPGNYYDSADRNVLACAIIEDRAGLDACEAIAATPGIDLIFIGTGDLSFALGCRGDQSAPEVTAAVAHIATAAKRHGKYLGRPAGTAAQIRQWRDDGFQFFQTGTELGLLTAGAKQLLAPLGISGVPRAQRALY